MEFVMSPMIEASVVRQKNGCDIFAAGLLGDKMI